MDGLGKLLSKFALGIKAATRSVDEAILPYLLSDEINLATKSESGVTTTTTAVII